MKIIKDYWAGWLAPGLALIPVILITLLFSFLIGGTLNKWVDWILQ